MKSKLKKQQKQISSIGAQTAPNIAANQPNGNLLISFILNITWG
jgi:hypothetical protein